jgi:dolichyl-diphosphooligosaccharide--protein glycosyltransferase
MRLGLGFKGLRREHVITFVSLIVLLASAVVGSYLRLYPVFNALDAGYGPMLNELDPYSEYWTAEKLLEKGLSYFFSLNRYNEETHIFWYPWGRDFVKSSLPLTPMFSVVTYYVARLFSPGLTLYEWMVYVPVIFFILSLVGIYLTTRELWGDIPAAVSSVVAAIIFNSRQLAGFTVKYSAGLGFIFLATYFHVRTWKRRNYVDALLCGVFSSLTAAGWAGFNLLLAAIFLQIVLQPLIVRVTKEDLILWGFETLPLALTIAILPFYGPLYLVLSVGILIPLGFAVIGIALFLEYVSTRRVVKLKYPLLTKWRVIYFLLIVLIGVGGLLGLTTGVLHLKGKGLAAMGLGEMTHVLVGTVQEYASASAQNFIWSSGAPLIISLLMLVYFAYRAFMKKSVLDLFIGIMVLLATYATANVSYFFPYLNCVISISQGSFIALLVPYLSRRKDLVLALLSASLMIAYLFTTLLQGVTVWAPAYRAQTPMILDSGLGVGKNVPAWLDTLEWIRNNTPKDSVVISWWDYGYWLSVLGERATVADGATLNATQIELLAKALTGTEEEAYEIFTKYFRVPPDKTYVVLYDVVLFSEQLSSTYVGPLAFQGGTFIGADMAKGITAIYKIAGRKPPTTTVTIGQYNYVMPNWTSPTLTNATLYKLFLHAVHEAFGVTGYPVRFLYGALQYPQYAPRLEKPVLTVFKPAHIAVSQLYEGSSVYVVVAVYKMGG